MPEMLLFECKCGSKAHMNGIAADEDRKLYLDVACPSCRATSIITTSIDELRALHGTATHVHQKTEPRYAM